MDFRVEPVLECIWYLGKPTGRHKIISLVKIARVLLRVGTSKSSSTIADMEEITTVLVLISFRRKVSRLDSHESDATQTLPDSKRNDETQVYSNINDNCMLIRTIRRFIRRLVLDLCIRPAYSNDRMVHSPANSLPKS